MTDEAAPGGAGKAPLETLADKVNWVLDKAHPAGRGRFSDAEVCFKIHAVTGEQISTTTIWKLRNGQLTNPQLRVIEALAKTFGVPAGFSSMITTRQNSGCGGSRSSCWRSSGTPGSPPRSSAPSSGWTPKAARPSRA